MQARLLLWAGTSLEGLTRIARRGLDTVYFVFLRHKEWCIVTSTTEGTHRAGSLHYGGWAFDIEKPQKSHSVIMRECKKALGEGWQIVIEANHWHFEYDPKGWKGQLP